MELPTPDKFVDWLQAWASLYYKNATQLMSEGTLSRVFADLDPLTIDIFNYV